MGASSGGGGMGGAKSLSEHQRMQRDAARVSGPGRSPSSRGIPGTSGYAALNSGGGGSSSGGGSVRRGASNYGNFRSVSEARAAGALGSNLSVGRSVGAGTQSSLGISGASGRGLGSNLSTGSRSTGRSESGGGVGSNLQITAPSVSENAPPFAGEQLRPLPSTQVAAGQISEPTRVRPPAGPTLRLTPDGLLLLNEQNRETSERVGSNVGQGGQPQNENIPQPTPTPPSEPSPPAARPRQRAAPLARPRIDPLRDNTLLTLSLADVTRKTLLGV